VTEFTEFLCALHTITFHGVFRQKETLLLLLLECI